MELCGKSGIYEIVNLINGKRYVGSSRDLELRKQHHFYYLGVNKHHNIHLQRAYDKYGSASFVFRVLEFCELTDLIVREQHYVDDRAEYNIRKECVNSCLGLKHSEASRKKMSKSHKGKLIGPHSEETKAKISASNKGKKRPPVSDETRAKLSAAHSGRIVSDRTRAKIAKTLRGRRCPDSVRAKISVALSGRSLPAWHVEKAAATHRGSKRSDAARANISAGLRRSYAKKKDSMDGDILSA